MATKTITKPEVHSNGDGNFPPPVHKLEGFQGTYARKLIVNFEDAKLQVNMIQASFNDFIVACAEEKGIVLWQDGWQFDSDKLEFFQVKENGVTHGDDTRPK